jgi:hypothetical protein
MHYPDFLVSANLLLCEKVLHEADGVSSAIRIIDSFFIPQDEIDGIAEGRIPVVTFWATALFKVVPGHKATHTVELVLTDTMGQQMKSSNPVTFTSTDDTEEFPGGGVVAVSIRTQVKKIGVCYVTLLIDGVGIARTPLILRKISPLF